MRRFALMMTMLATAAAGLAGCGGKRADTAAGHQIFLNAGCATCHTLSAAAATGTIGPDLDKVQPGAPVVEQFVRNGSGQMPSFANRLSDAQIKAVADYVSSVAGSSSG